MTKRILKMALPAVVSLAVLPVAGQADEFKLKSKQKIKTEYVERKVIDTLEAVNYFNASKKPVLLAKYQKNVEMQKRVAYLSQTDAKKVSSPEDLELMSKAYEAYRSTHPNERKFRNSYYKDMTLTILTRGIYSPKQKIKEVYDKNVAKGKLTPEVRKYLQFYNEHLKESLRSERRMIDLGWSAWLEEDEIPYKIVTDTIISKKEVTEKDVWNYINEHKLDFVSEKTRDLAFEAPTSLLTGKKWLLKKCPVSSVNNSLNTKEELFYGFNWIYNDRSDLLTGELLFRQDGTYSLLLSIECVESNTTWIVSRSGKWMRYKGEHICTRHNASSLLVKCAVYKGTPYHLLSERIKSNVDDIANNYVRFIREFSTNDNMKYPYDSWSNKCERLDNDYLILGERTYVSESKYNDILETLLNGETIKYKKQYHNNTKGKTVEDMPKYFNFK